MTAPAPAEQHLSVSEVAAALSCSTRHVYDLVAAGRLAAVDISASSQRTKLRVPQSALTTFLSRNKI